MKVFSPSVVTVAMLLLLIGVVNTTSTTSCTKLRSQTALESANVATALEDMKPKVRHFSKKLLTLEDTVVAPSPPFTRASLFRRRIKDEDEDDDEPTALEGALIVVLVVIIAVVCCICYCCVRPVENDEGEKVVWIRTLWVFEE